MDIQGKQIQSGFFNGLFNPETAKDKRVNWTLIALEAIAISAFVALVVLDHTGNFEAINVLNLTGAELGLIDTGVAIVAIGLLIGVIYRGAHFKGRFKFEFDRQVYIPQPTMSDGSCGIHALLGDVGSGIVRVKDVGGQRKAFCDYLRENPIEEDGQYHDSEIAFWIKNGFDLFKDGSPKGKERTWEDYLVYLENTKTFLLFQELIGFAIFNQKPFILFQPQPYGNNLPSINQRPVVQHVYCPDELAARDPVYIWYNGYNHFEKAALQK